MESGVCPFCEIGTGRTEQEVVYADGAVVAFLCEPPATWGHTLIVPRAHARDIWSTVLPGCVWGAPPWQPPAGGDAERRRVADALRRVLAGH